jgi:LCP family protein required for cell wall assembly
VVAATVAGVLGVLSAVGAWFVLGGGDGQGKPASAPARTQTTLLVQVLDAKRETVAAALMAHDTAGGGTGYGALVPSSLVVTAPGQGSVSFAATSTGGVPNASVEAVADALGVQVDGSLQMDASALAALVDAVGGVDVTVDKDVTQTQGRKIVVVVSAGPAHLTGRQAAAYATFLGPQEAEQLRLARFSSVWQALLGKLPADPAALDATVKGLRAHLTSSMSAGRLDSVLEGLRSDEAGQRLSFDTVPTRQLDQGGGPSVLVVDTTALPALLQAGFAGSMPSQAAGPAVRVVVQNGVGTPGLVPKARDRLLKAGLVFVSGGNADKFGYPHSYVLILDTSDTSRAQGEATARALGLPLSDITVTDQGQTLADVVVVLGADFKA